MGGEIFMRLPLFRITVVALLIVLLSGCGKTSSAPSSGSNPVTPTSKASASLSPTLTPSPTLAPSPLPENYQKISFDVQQNGFQLHINSEGGLHCFYGDPLVLNPIGPSEIILRHDPSSYTSAQINQMTDYVNNWFQLKAQQLPLPEGFQVPSVPVGETPFSDEGPQSGCHAELEITDTGQAPVQVQLLDMRLTATPQVNIQIYRFVDFCTFITIPNTTAPCPPQRAGGVRFNYTFNLSEGVSGQVFSPEGGQDSTQPGTSFTVDPTGPTFLSIDFSSTPDNITYSLVPELVINTSQGQQTITLSQLAATISFVDPSQITCYGLQGETIIPITRTNTKFCV
jgi:hypothetical protein